MRKVFLGMSLAVVTIIFSGLAWAGDISNNSLNKIMALSGLNKQITELPAGIEAGIAQEKQRNSSISDTELKELIATKMRYLDCDNPVGSRLSRL